MRKIRLDTVFVEYDSKAELTTELSGLFDRAVDASKDAYAPYSEFFVGAAVLLDNGEVVIGNNQENVAYPSGLCAERVAIYSAGARYPNSTIKAIAVYAKSKNFETKSPVSPCGSCRQAMAEYEQKQKQPIVMLMGGTDGKVIQTESICELLPLVFVQEELKGV